MDDRWNTVFDDFEGVMREVLPRGRPAAARVPIEPPAELTRDYEIANRLIDRLTERGIHVHFEVAEGNELHIHVLDNGGHTIRGISPLGLINALADDRDLLGALDQRHREGEHVV